MPKNKHTPTLRENIGNFQSGISPYLDVALVATTFVLGCYTWHWYGFTTLGNIFGVALGTSLLGAVISGLINRAVIITPEIQKPYREKINEAIKNLDSKVSQLEKMPDVVDASAVLLLKNQLENLKKKRDNADDLDIMIKNALLQDKFKTLYLTSCSVAIGVCVTSVIAAEGMSLALAAAGGAISGAVGGLLFTSCQNSQTGVGLPYGLSILTGAGLGAAAGVTAYAGTASLCSTASLGVLAPEVAVLSYAAFAIPIMYIGSVLASTVATRFGAA